MTCNEKGSPMALLDTEVIIERRLACGLSQVDLARELGVSTAGARGLERGRNHSVLTLHRLQLLAGGARGCRRGALGDQLAAAITQ